MSVRTRVAACHPPTARDVSNRATGSPPRAPHRRPGQGALAALLELGQDELGDGLQRLEDADAGGRDRLVLGDVPRVEQPAELLDRGDVRQVALVVLDHVRDLVEVVALLGEVHSQVLDRLDVGLHALDLRVGHEDDTVHALQDQLPAGVVEHLAGDRVEVEAGLEPPDLAEREGQEVAEERALGLGRQGDHLPLRVRVRLRVDVLQVRRLPAEAGAVIDDLAVDLARAVVDEAHRSGGRSLSGHSLNRLSMSSSVISAKGLAAPGAACFFASASNTRASSSPAFFTRSLTSPSELFASKITTRTTRPATMLMWRDSRSPSWNWLGNSFSPMSFASPPMAATLPAVSEASEVVSMFCACPADAMSCPFLSTRKTTLAFASRVSRS